MMQFWTINFLIFIIYTAILKKFKKDNLFLVVALLHFGLLSALRNVTVGTDTLHYARGYVVLGKNGHLMNHAMSSSKLFLEYMWLGSRFIKSEIGYMILSTIPTIICVYTLVKYYSFDYYSSIFVFVFSYFYFGAMNTSRQYMAITMTFLSFHFFNQKKYISSVFLYLLAVSIHSAAFPFFLYFIIKLIKWNEKKIMVFSVALASSLFLIPVFFDLTIKIWPSYAWMRKALFSAKLTSGGRQSLIYGAYSLVAFLGMLYCILYSNNRFRITEIRCSTDIQMKIKNDEMQIQFSLMALVIMACTIYFFFPRVIIYSRVAMTFFSYSIILLPNALAPLQGRAKIVKYVVLAPLVLFTYLQLSQGYANVDNYSFFY